MEKQINNSKEINKWKRFFKYHHNKKFYSILNIQDSTPKIIKKYIYVWLYVQDKSEYSLYHLYDDEHLIEIYNTLRNFTAEDFKVLNFIYRTN